jgi:pimeloyl-ACP methyl ester carboxylesterase
MAQFTSRDASRSMRIGFDDVGQGAPILLIHGFASSRSINWQRPGWYDALIKAGRRVIALDLRGHGESEKPHDEGAYAERLMAGDVIHLMDHLGIESADVMGYSMGGFITLHLLMEHRERFAHAIIGGVGENYFAPVTVNADRVVEALLAPNASAVSDPVAKTFRVFAESSGSDLHALAACFKRSRTPYSPQELAGVTNPVLIVVGDKDAMIGSVEPLASAIPNSKLVIVKGRDHMLTVGDKAYKEAAIAFLGVR